AVGQRSRALAWAGRLGLDGTRVPADAAALPALSALGTGPTRHRPVLHAVHARFSPAVRPRQRRVVEGARAGLGTMTSAPLPKFVLHCSTFLHELRKQRDTSTSMILVPLSI